MTSKSFRQYLSNIPGKHNIQEPQKTAILGIAHILRKVLMLKYKTSITGNNITCTISLYYNHRTAATLSTLDTWFVLGI